MSAQATQVRADAASAYQQQLEELASELQIAMGAIASNSLHNLEESVAKQELICARLTTLARALGERLLRSEPALQAPSDTPIDQKISATSKTIRDLNLQYASLLKHSGRTIALLSSLCRSHTGHFPEVRGTRLKQQTWSCQM